MKGNLPSFLIQGETARLFPVLSTTSKEGRTTSIVLACLAKIDEFGAVILEQLGLRVGKRARIETFTEIVCKNRPANMKDRPDGLIILHTGRTEWRALVEAKIGNNDLNTEQIEKYRQIARDNDIDCVITISNQFSTNPSTHPVEEVRKSRSKVPVYHLSWMSILTEADLLIGQDNVADIDQKILLNELRRFLTHESAGVKGFDRMPKEWSYLNKLVSSGGTIPVKSPDAAAVIGAWHQETRDLSLILSRMTETNVSERLSRRHKNDRAARLKDELSCLRDRKQLVAMLDIANASAPLKITADITRRSVDVGMTLRAPEDKVSTKARLNWLLRQIKTPNLDNLYVRLLWPGKAEPTQHAVHDLREYPELAIEGKEHLSPHSFHIFYAVRLGTRFTQQSNFISDLEEIVPAFYRDVGSHLAAWQKAAPKVKKDKSNAENVSTEAIAEDARDYKLD